MTLDPGDSNYPVTILVKFPNVIDLIPHEHPQVSVDAAPAGHANPPEEEPVRDKATISVVNESPQAMYKRLVKP